MSDKIELLHVEAYKARCPNKCGWEVSDENAERVVHTMKTHMRIACPNNPDAVKSWSYEARSTA